MNKNNITNILIFIMILLFLYNMNEINNLKKTKENFDTTTDNAIKTAVKKIYLADVEAIRILSNFAIQLSQNGTTVPGNVTFNGEVKMGSGDNQLCAQVIKTAYLYNTKPHNAGTIKSDPHELYIIGTNTSADGRRIIRLSDDPYTTGSFSTNILNPWNDTKITVNGDINVNGVIKSNSFAANTGDFVNINGAISLNSTNINPPTCVRINPNSSAISFNNLNPLTNRWVIRGDNSNSLNFQGWNTTNNIWSDTILSINQDKMINCSGYFKVSSINKNPPTNITINPDYSAITFNHENTLTNRWMIHGNNSNSLNFQGWNTTNNNWSDTILSINQDYGISANGNINLNSNNNFEDMNNGWIKCKGIQIGNWLIYDRGDGLNFTMNTVRGNDKYMMYPNSTGIWSKAGKHVTQA